MSNQIRTDTLKLYVVKTRKNGMTEYRYFMEKNEAERYADKHNTKIE